MTADDPAIVIATRQEREERMADDTQKVLIRQVPPRLKGKIARRVRDTRTNMNDVLAGILAAHYGVTYTPSGTAPREVGESANVMLDLPAELRDAIDLDAQASKDTLRNTVVRVWCQEFRVAFEPTGRWVRPRGRRRAA